MASVTSIFAQKSDADNPNVAITLQDGDVVKGTYIKGVEGSRDIVIKEQSTDKKIKYNQGDIKTLVLYGDNDHKDSLVYIPVKVRFNYKKKPEEEPTIMIETYIGKHVKGYKKPLVYDNTVSFGSPFGPKISKTRTTYVWEYYCMLEDEECVSMYRCSYVGNKSNIGNLKKRFKLKKQLLDAIISSNPNWDQINERPEILLEMIDGIIDAEHK